MIILTGKVLRAALIFLALMCVVALLFGAYHHAVTLILCLVSQAFCKTPKSASNG